MSEKLTDLAKRLRDHPKPPQLKFQRCTVPGRYSWGAVTSADEATIRLLCDVWNNRHAIAAAILEDQ